MAPKLTLSFFLLLLSLASFAQSPISGTPSVCIGSTRTLTDSVSGGSWSSSNTAIATVGITSGVVTGVSAGTTTITYTHSGSYVTVPFTVLAPPSAITGTPTVSVGATTTLSDATGGGYWSSGNTGIATVNPSTGVVTGVSAGTCGIYYILTTGCGVYTVMTVTSSSSSLPPIMGTPSVCVGSTRTLTDSAGGAATWSSSNTAVATINMTSGVVTGVAAGTATITYTHSGSYVTITFTVLAPPSAITGTTTVSVGATTTLADATGGGYWSSGNTGIATVNATTGVVTGVSAGTCGIYYTLTTGCGVYTVMTVTSSSSSLPPIMGTPSVCVGSTRTLTDFAGGAATWSSSNTAVATINMTSGVVTGVSAGTATITYTHSGSYVTVTFTVLAPPSAITGTTTVSVGTTTALADATGGGHWSSGNTGIATVNATTGVVTGVSAGTCGIYYTLTTGCGVYTVMTVTSSSSSLPPIMGTPSVCVGSTRTLTDSAGGAATWSSSNTAVATINMTSGVVTGVSAGTATITYTHSGSYVTVTFTVLAPPSAITGTTTVSVGATTTLSDATGGGYWSSGNTGIATVNPSTGIVTGVSAGTCGIYYTLTTGCGVYTVMTVTSSSSSLPPIMGTPSVCVGSTRTLTDSAGGAATWSSSNTAVATINMTSGVVTGVSAGTATITYTHSGSYVTVTFTVNAPPAAISGSSSVCAGATITLSDATAGGTWTCGSSSVVTVTSAGVVSGVGAGVTNVYYSIGGCYAYHTVTVDAAASISGSSSVCSGSTITLTASPSGGTWACGSSSIATVTSAGVVSGVGAGVTNVYYSIGGCYAYHTVTVDAAASISGSSSVCSGSTIALTASPSGGTWAIGSSSIATVTTAGVVSGVGAGVTNVYYSIGGCYAYHTVTVDAAASISGSSSVCSGSTITLTASPSGGTWAIGSSSIATVTSAGVVSGAGAGVTNVYYSIGGCYAYHTLTVDAAASISGSSTVCSGSTITLTASPSGGTWAIGSSSIATVTSAGVVSGAGAGVTNVYYSIGGCYAYHTVTVDAAASISGSSTICSGSTITLTASPSGGTWAIGSSSIATVTSAGVVSGAGAGVTNVYYSIGGCYAYHTVTVDAAASISGSSTVCSGSTITLTASPAGGTWTCGSSSIATVTSAGVVSGVGAGVTNVYYSIGGCYAYHTVTVEALPAITAIATPASCGYSYTLSATGGSIYSWLPTAGLTCAFCATTSDDVTATAIYTVTGTNTEGCSSKASVTVDGNRIIGYINFSSTPPDSLEMKVWLIHYNPTDSTLTALDSTYTCLLPGGTTPYYQFYDRPAGNYMVKAEVLHNDPVGSGGYVPTYGYSSLHWYSATTIAHTSATDYSSITMLYGSVPAGPGFIGGSISLGAGRGTNGFVPVVGMLVQLLDAATNDVVAYTYTNDTGAYSFGSLAEGSYIVYPEDYVYYTTQSSIITLNSSSESVANVDFKQHTIARTITPETTVEGVTPVSSGGSVDVYPNPASDNVIVKWNNQAIGTASVIITDVVGREVYNASVNMNTASGQTQIGLDLKNGMYLMTIKSGSINYAGRLMIQRQ